MNLQAEIVKLRVATQVAPRRWRGSLESFLADVERGQSWDDALEHLAKSRPDLAALLRAASQAGQPAEITLEIMRQRDLGRVGWRQFALSLSYPLSLLVLVVITTSIVNFNMARAMESSMKGWDTWPNVQVAINELYRGALGGILIVLWGCLFCVSIYWVASPIARLKLVSLVPMFGRVQRWLAMSELLTRVSIFSRHQPRLSSALQLTAESFGQSPLAMIAMYVSHRVEAGESFASAVHSTIVSDSRAGLALTVIEPQSMASSTAAAARLLEHMVEMTCARLNLIFPPLIIFTFAAIVWRTWASFAEIVVSVINAFY